MGTVWSRIAEAAAEKWLAGDSAIAKAIGVQAQAVGNWRKLKQNTDLKSSTLLSLAESLDVEPAWIATGRLPKRRDGFNKVVMVRCHENGEGFPLPVDLFIEHGLDRDACRVLRARSDNMAPSIRVNDAVLFDTGDVDPISSGKIYVLDWGAEVLSIRRLFLEPDGSLISRSDNRSAEYVDRMVAAPCREVRVHGRVRWVGRWED